MNLAYELETRDRYIVLTKILIAGRHKCYFGVNYYLDKNEAVNVTNGEVMKLM